MRVHDALGNARGARCIHQQGMISGADIMQRRHAALLQIEALNVSGIGRLKDSEALVMDKGKARFAMLKRIGNGIAPCGQIDHRRPKATKEHAIKRRDGGTVVRGDNGDALAFLRAAGGDRLSKGKSVLIERLP